MNNIITPNFGALPKEASLTEKPKQMLTVVREAGRTTVRINSSSLSLIQTCPRKAFYLLKEGWHARTVSPPLVFGQAIHAALEVFYAYPAAVREIPTDFEEHAQLIGNGFPPPEHHFLYDAITAFTRVAEPLAQLPNADKRSVAAGIWTLSHYFRTYINDPYVTYCDDKGPVTERTFSCPLLEFNGGPLGPVHVELFGTIDFALRNMVTGEVLCGDHKTSSQMGSDFLNRIKPNHQYTGYMYGAKAALGIQSDNFLINGVQVKPRPLTARGSPPIFTRQITKRTREDFDEFRDAVAWAVRSYLAWDEAQRWPLGNVDSCSLWGGCPFLDICSAPNSLRQNILESKYERISQ